MPKRLCLREDISVDFSFQATNIRQKSINSPKTRQKKEEASFETSSCGDLVRWARLELAQAYAHYPLKVACLPFHHHRFFVLGLQRYALFLNFQTFSQKFSNIFLKILDHMFYHADFQDNRPKILSE